MRAQLKLLPIAPADLSKQQGTGRDAGLQVQIEGLWRGGSCLRCTGPQVFGGFHAVLDLGIVRGHHAQSDLGALIAHAQQVPGLGAARKLHAIAIERTIRKPLQGDTAVRLLQAHTSVHAPLLIELIARNALQFAGRELNFGATQQRRSAAFIAHFQPERAGQHQRHRPLGAEVLLVAQAPLRITGCHIAGGWAHGVAPVHGGAGVVAIHAQVAAFFKQGGQALAAAVQPTGPCRCGACRQQSQCVAAQNLGHGRGVVHGESLVRLLAADNFVIK